MVVCFGTPQPLYADATPQELQKSTDLLLSQRQDPLARKLLVWLYATESKLPIHAPDLINFTRNNKDWPRLHTIRLKIEQNIGDTITPANTITWFNENPPETADGIKAYIRALMATQQQDRAKHALKSFWERAVLTKKDTVSLIGIYPRILTADDHEKRLNRMIWESRYSEAEALLPFVSANSRAIAAARLALAQNQPNASTLVQNLTPAQLQNEGITFERLRWRRMRGMDSGALEMLAQKPAAPAEPAAWWREMNILARRKLEAKDYHGAYNIIQKHKMSEGSGYAQAEWLLGWIELRFLKQPGKALPRFSKLHDTVNAAISKARAAYWAARAAEALPDGVLAQAWHRKAAAYTSTFYGQLSYAQLYGAAKPGAFRDPVVTEEKVQAFAARETVRVVRMLHAAGLTQFLDPFLARLLLDAKAPEDYVLVARLARETGRYYYAVQANKDIQTNEGLFMPVEGYPVLPPLPLQAPEKSLVHAIIQRESMFNTLAVSPAGARGLMQLMPGTARDMARKTGEGYSAEKLTLDARFNVLLGSTYLQELIRRYDGFYPMAIAAYNAGPARVSSWIEQFGDPRDSKTDMIDWIEQIPIYETRNYVQRVM
ncbi:MAG TPA: lytic transglycosylase domain-containing protein, partial [Alphaproteobacteria bacterium]|nr:lytic transglycosylase domain-containing protein [Alphaproteobacteria bacterium]